MSTASVIGLIIFSVFFTSYAWGMRGTTIGGEKGAMLPGAVIGLALACFSDILIVKENFFVFAALGSCGMYFGGSMTYGETLSISMSKRPAENMKKGLTALFVKGFGWFGAFGGIFSVGTLAVSGQFKLYEVICIAAALPASMLLFYFIFNRPYKPRENIFPKIYFSYTRPESWGALIGLFLMCLITVILKKSFFGIIFTVFCAFGGAFGWVAAQLLQVFIKHYAFDCKFKPLQLLSEKRGAESWKAMECTLGAFGGLFAALGFIVGYNDFYKLAGKIEINGGIYAISNNLSDILMIVWLVLIAIDLVHFFVKPPKEEEELKRDLLNGKINQIQYEEAIAGGARHSKAFNIYQTVVEGTESSLYAAIPFIIICLGSLKTASLVSFFLIAFVVIQEVALEKEPYPKAALPLKIIYMVVAASVFVVNMLFEPSAAAAFILYAVFYELTALYFIIPRIVKSITEKMTADGEKFIKSTAVFKEMIKNKGFMSVHGYFVLCILISAFVLLR